MNKKSYEKLINQLDVEILKLQSFSPKVPIPAEFPRSVGLVITKDTKVSEIEDKNIPIVHTMLHMFYNNKSGKGLNKNIIKRLHKDIVNRLKIHNKFDGLDKNE